MIQKRAVYINKIIIVIIDILITFKASFTGFQ